MILPTYHNPAAPTIMHIDLNSCFASVEQQANPRLRGLPIAVCAYTTPGGCILAPSIEAKTYGVKTGMRVFEGKQLCPRLIVLPSDPPKYRHVNLKFRELFGSYTDQLSVESIDEMVLKFAHTPVLKRKVHMGFTKECIERGIPTPVDFSTLPTSQKKQILTAAMIDIAQEIKKRINKEIGDWLKVSIGIATNAYLAKIAACLNKPNGLDVIASENVTAILKGLELEELTGIKEGYGGRLRRSGITSAYTFYTASHELVRRAFNSTIGTAWYLRLKGWESGDKGETQTKTIGHSHALSRPYYPTDAALHQILCELTEKVGDRMRRHGFQAHGIHIACNFRSTDGVRSHDEPLSSGWGIRSHRHGFWHHGEKIGRPLYRNDELYMYAKRILLQAPQYRVGILAITACNLSHDLYQQQLITTNDQRREELTKAIDDIHARFGRQLITSGRLLQSPQTVKDRIAFGKLQDMPEIQYKELLTYESLI